MKKSLKERFSHRSFLFILAMMLSINTFIFVMIFIINQLLLGFYFSGLLVLGIVIVLFLLPYYIASRRLPLKKMNEILKDDIFLMGFSLAFVSVGLILMIILITIFYF